MKFCIDCSDPIYEPVLAFNEEEVCECCAIEEIDELKALKQEAFAAGWRQARRELSQGEANRAQGYPVSASRL